MFFCERYKDHASACSSDDYVLTKKKKAYDQTMKLKIALSDLKQIFNIYLSLSFDMERLDKEAPLFYRYLKSKNVVKTITFEKFGCWVSEDDLNFKSPSSPTKFFQYPPFSPLMFLGVDENSHAKVYYLRIVPSIKVENHAILFSNMAARYGIPINEFSGVEKLLKLKSIKDGSSLLYDLKENLYSSTYELKPQSGYDEAFCFTCPFDEECKKDVIIEKFKDKEDEISGLDLF